MSDEGWPPVPPPTGPPVGAIPPPPAPGTPLPPSVAYPRHTNGYAIAAMVLGIAGFVAIPLLGHILAVVFGYIGKGQIDRSSGAEEGRGMAIAGLVLGWIGIALSILAIIAIIIVAAVVSTHGAKIIINNTTFSFSPG
jgi:hypothetical protein